MIVVLLIAFALICFVVDLTTRALLERVRKQRVQREREQALAVSLKLDFSREAKSLKRVEVDKPVARILCVDDEEIILDCFRRILVLDGYAVDTVETGQEALGLLQTHHYDFVFTDLRMPTMDGFEVVKAVKHLRPEIDVIIITGYASVETAVECMKHGAMDYVQKPFTEDELRSFVKKVLIRRQDERARRLRPQVSITAKSDIEQKHDQGFSIPGGVFISQGHCWASLGQDGSVRVGLDDFAKKLIGRIDAIEMPSKELPLRAGQVLFTVRQGTRRIDFLAPLSGRITETNPALAMDPNALATSPYHNQWICVIAGDDLDRELPSLKIGKSAVALFQEDLARFTNFLKGSNAPRPSGTHNELTLCQGAMETLTDEQWNRAVESFFGPRS